MNNLKIKVCGMKDPENISGLARLEPDYMGMIFYEKSPRFVDTDLDFEDRAMKRTGVFVDASEGLILEKVEKYKLDILQLHGHETPEFCRGLREKLSIEENPPKIIKVFSIKEEFDFDILKAYEELVDFFLFDTKGKDRGGNGIKFNWEILKDYPSSTPFFLSGGIGIEEIAAIKELQKHFEKENKTELLYAVDVNSRFETSPGIKNLDKLKIFKDSLLS